MSTENSAIVKEIFESTKYMIDASLNNAPFDKTVNGVILGASGKTNYYQVSVKGKTFTLPSHINNTLKPNTAVNIMVPQNNMDLAFIYTILGGEEKGGGGGSVIHADTADYATQAGYAETVKIATDKLVGGVLSSSGTDKVSVDPNTGVMTVDKVSEAINADNAHHADTAEDVINVPIASSTFVGGIKSSTGPGHVQVDENGIATVPDAGGIKEVPVATETEIGGILSGTNSGSVAVDESGNTSVNDIVTMDKTAHINVPIEFGEGPWTIEMTEDNNPDDPSSGLPQGGDYGDILVKSSDVNYDSSWKQPYNLYTKAPQIQPTNPGVYYLVNTTDLILPSWDGKLTPSKTPEPTSPASITGVPFYIGVVNAGTTKSASLEMTGLSIPGHDGDKNYIDWYDGTTGEFVQQIFNYQITGNESWTLVSSDNNTVVIKNSNVLYNPAVSDTDSFCTHFQSSSYSVNGSEIQISIPSNILSSANLDGAKLWLQSQASSSTPVTIYYVASNAIKLHKKLNVTGCEGYVECWGATRTEIIDGRVPMVGGYLPFELIRCNPNLLDNWYFINPVNQLSEMQYNTNGNITIDRWTLNGSGTVILATSITNPLKLISSSGTLEFTQKTSFSSYDTVTFSVFVKSGIGSISVTNLLSTSINGYGVYSVTVNGFSETTNFFSINTTSTLEIIAAKLEYGAQQTLCKKVGDNWVLNETPNYAVELLKCQRYMYIVNYVFPTLPTVDTSQICIPLTYPTMNKSPIFKQNIQSNYLYLYEKNGNGTGNRTTATDIYTNFKVNAGRFIFNGTFSTNYYYGISPDTNGNYFGILDANL